MGILDSKEERQHQKDIERIRNILVRTLMRMFNEETNEMHKEFFLATAKSAAFSPIRIFSQRDVLMQGVEKNGNLYSVVQIRGQNVFSFIEQVINGKKQISVANEIQLPSIWMENGKLDPDKLMTVLHEISHGATLYMDLPPMNEMQSEQMADTIAVRTAIRLGFPSEVIFNHLQGRIGIIGEEYHARLMGYIEKHKNRRIRFSRNPKRTEEKPRVKFRKLEPPLQMGIRITGKTRHGIIAKPQTPPRLRFVSPKKQVVAAKKGIPRIYKFPTQKTMKIQKKRKPFRRRMAA